MKWLLTLLRWIYSIYAMTIFIGLMLLILPFALLASTQGRIRGGNMIFRLCTFWADCWFPLIGIFYRRILEAPHDKKKQYIFVCNHISYLDSALLAKTFRQPIRPLGKVELSKVPLFGFIYKNAIVSVDRSSTENRIESVRILKSIISKGISVLVFPEGTFNMTNQPLKSFYDGAFRLALETQTPIKPVLFLDTYERMHYGSIFSMTPGRCRVVYLEEVTVEGLNLSDLELLKQRVYHIMEAKLKEYKAPWVG